MSLFLQGLLFAAISITIIIVVVNVVSDYYNKYGN